MKGILLLLAATVLCEHAIAGERLTDITEQDVVGVGGVDVIL